MQFFGILCWWLIISTMGIIAIPIAFKTFAFLPDRGYAFTKPLGLLLAGLLAWLLGFIGFSIFTLIIALGLLAGFSFWLGAKYKAEIRSAWEERKGYILVVELFFAALFLLFLFFRMYNPDILGTEKFMDMAFLHSILRAPSFPPYDPWMAGPELYISYYYFGYLLMSILTKLSGVPAAIGFNLALGMLFALSGTALFGVLYNLTRRMLVGFGGWAMIYMLGNLDGFRQFLTTRSLENFNWWTPSRIIPDTINEFPFFSFLLGDMHPHMLAVPYFLMSLGLGLNQLKSREPVLTLKSPEQLGRYILWGIVIGALGFINSWDLPTAFFIALLAFFFQQYGLRQRVPAMPWKGMLAALGVILVVAIIPYLPFYIHFRTQAKGMGLTTQNTNVKDYLLIFGTFTFMAITFLAARYHAWFLVLLSPAGNKPEPGRKKGAYCPQCGKLVREGKRICGQCGHHITPSSSGTNGESPLAGTAGELPGQVRNIFMFLLQPVLFWRRSEGRKTGIIVMAVLIMAGAAIGFKSAFLGLVILSALAAAVLLFTRIDRPETIFALSLLFTAWFLVFGCEVLHINDTFNPPLDRMNTVFKLYYQAWFLLGIAGVYGVYWAFKHSLRHANLKAAWLVVMVLFIAASLVYPYAATMVKTNHFKNVTTLDGSDYLKNNYPADREGIEWLRQNVRGCPVVLEATGGEYTDFARVSTFTGLPTVLGWAGHELQWRGNYDEPGRRIPDIDALYGGNDIEKARTLIDKYNIQYVFVGTLERNKYPGPGLNKFAAFMEKAYENAGGVTIYKRR